MKNSKKNLKLLFSATASVAVLGTTSATIVSCGHKSDTKNSWGDFKDKAMAETAINIVTYANVKATGWDVSKTGDFSFQVSPAVGEDGSTVVAVITSASNNDIAVFTATYSTDEEYIDTDWACTTQPNSGPSFDDFKTQAMKELAPSIVANASVKATGWDESKTSDFTFAVKPAVGKANSTVVATITSASNKNTAVFTATYVAGQEYVVGNWACTSQPGSGATWDDFKTKAMAESPLNIVTNASVKANGWDDLKNDTFTFFTKPAVGEEGSTITAKLASSTNKNNAYFTATYVPHQAYVASDWACTGQPNEPFNNYVKDAEKAVSTPKGISDIIQEINKLNPTSVPAIIKPKINDADFQASLKVEAGSEIQNPSNSTFTVTIDNNTHQSFELVATQHDGKQYDISDFNFRTSAPSIFNQWYTSAVKYLNTKHNKSPDNVLTTNLVGLANGTNAPNLYTLKDDGATLYATVTGISAFKEADQKITFKVALKNITDNKVRIQGISAQLSYTKELGTAFVPSEIQKSLALDGDGTIPAVQNLNKLININDIYN